MIEKDTDELNKVLGKTHLDNFDNYCKENKDNLNDETAFSNYIKNLLIEKNLTQQEVFLKADIPLRYGYKLLSGEKHTRQRDIILRICYAGELNLAETQRALKKYKMPELYAKIDRDALMMILFNERPGNIIDFNIILEEKGFEPLRSSGTLD